jgi:hypothetical protein
VLCSLATFHEGISAIPIDKKRKGVAIMKAEFVRVALSSFCPWVLYEFEHMQSGLSSLHCRCASGRYTDWV